MKNEKHTPPEGNVISSADRFGATHGRHFWAGPMEFCWGPQFGPSGAVWVLYGPNDTLTVLGPPKKGNRRATDEINCGHGRKARQPAPPAASRYHVIIADACPKLRRV